MKYNTTNKPLQCMMTQSNCYKGTREMKPVGVLWHSTGANNPWLKRYVQPDDNAANRDELLAKLGKNQYNNDWNHISRDAGLNCWIGKLADGSVATVQTMPWTYRPWGCGSGSKGSCNSGWIQFEICEDGLTDATYFNQVYKEACEITAYLCQMFGIDPHGSVNGVPTILCHADSYKLGMGSNHGDIYNWFPKHGKDMTNVRDDVAELLKVASVETSKPATSMNKREAYVAKMREWIGRNEADGSHKAIIDVYNKGLADAVKKWGTRNCKMDYSWAWCACCVSAAAMAAGVADLVPIEISCYYIIEIAKKFGLWVENDAYVPAAGDLILYDWEDSGAGDNTGNPDHVGVVETVANGKITVIEGNCSNSVKRRTLNVNGQYIRGFIVPKFGDAKVEEPKTPAATKTVDELAKEVIAGKWGNGEDRKQRLTAAGYNYSTVQARVNEMLAPKPATPSKTVDELAKEVIQGKWGNGQARKDALTKAGYDYSKVQARVNEILKAPTKVSEPQPEYYVVVKGDNLTKIAKRYGTTVKQLVEWNNIKNPDLIYVGQKFRVK